MWTQWSCLSIQTKTRVSFVRENSLTMKRMGAVESDSVKSQLGKLKIWLLHKACERASETCERTLHGQEQNNVHGKHDRVSWDSDRFLVNTQVQSYALLHGGFGTSVPFIFSVVVESVALFTHCWAIQLSEFTHPNRRTHTTIKFFSPSESKSLFTQLTCMYAWVPS